mgnify:CR=1 FL=1
MEAAASPRITALLRAWSQGDGDALERLIPAVDRELRDIATAVEGRTATFENQIVTGNMSQGGDSGSLIVTQLGNNPVALLFAGSSTRTLANPLEPVLARFGVTKWMVGGSFLGLVAVSLVALLGRALEGFPEPSVESELPSEAGAIRVAVVGRPNVGKSTLFNALTRTRDALVADVPEAEYLPLELALAVTDELLGRDRELPLAAFLVRGGGPHDPRPRRPGSGFQPVRRAGWRRRA